MQTPKKEVYFFFFSVCCIVFNCSWQLIMSIKRIHLVTDNGLYDRKVFYKEEIVFIYPLWMMANLSIIKPATLLKNNSVKSIC